jgi:hypothetical protein
MIFDKRKDLRNRAIERKTEDRKTIVMWCAKIIKRQYVQEKYPSHKKEKTPLYLS